VPVMTNVAIDEIRQLCVSALMEVGLQSNQARVVADDYIETEAAGRVSHGLAAFDVAIANASARGKATVERDSASLLVVKGNGDMGHLVVAEHLHAFVEKARSEGVALLAARSVSRLASPATLCRALARDRLVSLVVEYGGQAFVAPPGHREPSISTNPIAIGFPRVAGPAAILDIATSAKAYYFIKLAESLGLSIPPGWAFDPDGNVASDPSRAHTLASFGGYKGFGLGFMIELLTGPMLGVPAGRSGTLDTRGLLAVAIEPCAFGRSFEDVGQDVEAVINDLDSAPFPGMQSGKRLAAAYESGVLDVEEATLAQLRSIVDR
jgi:LDH2 family malate/lactate/ureidoglycolate dehydrogenase